MQPRPSSSQLPIKYQKAILECPDKCDPPMIWQAIPANPILDVKRNARCRCLSCLTYWEVNNRGEVINIRWGMDSKFIEETKKLMQTTKIEEK